jgi:3-oxoadipate enol-lactonase
MKVMINGFSMAYDDAGEGQPIVFVHGYPLNKAIWQTQLEGLSDIMRVLAPDLRGHGESQAMPGPYTMQLLVGDLVAFLEALGITQPVVLCGLSMGGYLAFEFNRRHPERLKALILTATRASDDTPQAKANRDLAAETARQGGPGAIVKKMLPVILSPATPSRQPALVGRVREIMENTSLEGVLGDLAALRDRPDSNPDLPRIRIPTLVVHGEQDQIIPYNEAYTMHQAIPGSSWSLIPDAGHLPCLENPLAYNKALRSFLQNIGG